MFEGNILPILGVALLKLKKHLLEVGKNFRAVAQSKSSTDIQVTKY